jgi:hypothetical protein
MPPLHQQKKKSSRLPKRRSSDLRGWQETQRKQPGRDTHHHKISAVVPRTQMMMVLPLGDTILNLINVAQPTERRRSGSEREDDPFKRNSAASSGMASRYTSRRLTMLWPLGP